jgi:hypothetical protein
VIDTLTGFVEKNWTRPYEVATALLGLLLIFGHLNEPLDTAADLLATLSAHTWSDALATANTWMNTHQVDGQTPAALIGVTAAAGFAALTVASLPTRSGGTFWVFAAIAVYGGATLGDLIAGVIVGVAFRTVIEAVRTTVGDAFETAGFCLVDIALGAFWLPLVVLIWIFMPRGGVTASKSA